MPHNWEYKNPVTNIDVAIVDQIIRWPDGRPVRLEIAVDITERKRAEEEREKLQAQLLQSQKLEAVGILAGGVAHDFNNMLGAIIGYAELTMSEMDPKDPFRKNLHRILDAAQRSGNLTRQLLAFARKQNIDGVAKS
jgi:C4-dicarboxylate-specific signal transduction histidine kinase